MADQLFRELDTREQSQQKLQTDTFIFEERNPLDETLLRQMESELNQLVGASKTTAVRITVLGHEDFQRAVRRIVPKRLQDKGLDRHFRVIADPRDPHHLYVGPSALAGLNDGHANVINDLVYHMVGACGAASNQAFERGAADLLAKHIAKQFKLDIFTDHYPEERKMVEAVIDAIREHDQDPLELVCLLRRNPKEFFSRVRNSSFYRWWEGSVKRDDRLSAYVNLIASLTSPNAQLEGSFMAWAKQCAEYYRDYREQQRRNALAGAAKRSSNS